jgi:hypothetical protein
MVNILQNVSRGQKVTLRHILYAMQAAFLTFYPGKTMYGTSQYHLPKGHFPHGFMYYVKGMPEGKASVIWGVAFYIDNTYGSADIQSSQHSFSIIKMLKNVEPSRIYDKLEIKEGEVKILVNCFCMYGSDGGRYFSDGRSWAQVSFREAFGFLILNHFDLSQRGEKYFGAIVAFNSKPGLFSEAPPS